jgi:hypothetical protein
VKEKSEEMPNEPTGKTLENRVPLTELELDLYASFFISRARIAD